MSGAAFGRKGAAGDAAMAARRAAFLAEERARERRPSQAKEEEWRPHPSEPVYVREKSMGTAYLLWFFVGGLGAHRFYLGYGTSGMAQLLLLVLSWMLLLSGALWAVAGLFFGALWLLGDVFVIPSLTREANNRLRQCAMGSVFA
jgi:TM2 domain-containing membrane protein YozV